MDAAPLGHPAGDAAVSDQIEGRELAALLKVGRALAGSLVLPEVLQTAVESAVDVLGLDAGVVYTLDGDDLYLGATVPPLPPEMPEEHRHALVSNHPHIARCLTDRAPFVIKDAREEDMTPEERLIVESRDLRSGIFVPLVADDRALGVVLAQSVGAVREFSDHDIAVCRAVAHQISLAVANAQLFQEVQHSKAELVVAYDATLRGWALAMEMRDHETRGHTERVAETAIMLAKTMGVPEAEMVHLRRGALLHDIGKMCVPDSILLKPGPLSEDEWVVMREHPEKARQMLAEIDYLAPAVDVPYCHHERWDGSGYPQGLAGEDIPLAGRIFAVVDVYDALTSDRPYRDAWSRDDAMAYVRDQAGRHFDPRAVDAFIRGVLGT